MYGQSCAKTALMRIEIRPRIIEVQLIGVDEMPVNQESTDAAFHSLSASSSGWALDSRIYLYFNEPGKKWNNFCIEATENFTTRL